MDAHLISGNERLIRQRQTVGVFILLIHLLLLLFMNLHHGNKSIVMKNNNLMSQSAFTSWYVVFTLLVHVLLKKLLAVS